MFVYSCATGVPMPTIAVPSGAHFRPLIKSDLRALEIDTGDHEFWQRQLKRLDKFGSGHVYGVYIGDKLAHISWLLPPAALGLESPLILRLQNGEAEISACETLPEFRGRGLYPFAIQQICKVAAEAGFHTIYMKTQAHNRSSQAGIHKAGLRMIGIATVFTPPAMPNKQLVIRRF